MKNGTSLYVKDNLRTKLLMLKNKIELVVCVPLHDKIFRSLSLDIIFSPVTILISCLSINFYFPCGNQGICLLSVVDCGIWSTSGLYNIKLIQLDWLLNVTFVFCLHQAYIALAYFCQIFVHKLVHIDGRSQVQQQIEHFVIFYSVVFKFGMYTKSGYIIIKEVKCRCTGALN